MNTEKPYSGPAPETRGRTIPWASLYDPIVWLLSLGKVRAFRRAMIEPVQINPGDRVLDVGCGTGDLGLAAKKLAGPAGEVHGIDASPKMIAVAQRKASKSGSDVGFRVGLIEDISFPDDHFDVVLSTLMMHHLPDDLKRTGLAEIYRVTKPGGHILIVDIDSSAGSVSQRLSDVMIQLHGGHAATHDNVKKLIPLVGAAGFTVVETGKVNRQLSFLLAQKDL